MGPFTATEATIVSFGSSAGHSAWGAKNMVVIVNTGEGVIMRTRVPIALLRHCRVGDSVEAESNGHVIKIDPQSCRH